MSEWIAKKKQEAQKHYDETKKYPFFKMDANVDYDITLTDEEPETVLNKYGKKQDVFTIIYKGQKYRLSVTQFTSFWNAIIDAIDKKQYDVVITKFQKDDKSMPKYHLRVKQ